MKHHCPRCGRIDESPLFVNNNHCRWCYDAVELADLADYLALAHLEAGIGFLESRHIHVIDWRRNDA